MMSALAGLVVRLRTLLVAFTAFTTAACAERGQRAGAADAQQPPVAVRDSAPRAPVDTVDSLTAMLRATVMDTTAIRRSSALDSARPSAQDTMRARAVSPRLGPR